MSAKLASGPRSAAQRTELRERYFTPLMDDLVARTHRAAQAGARIVVWAEASAYEFVEDKDAVLERARSVARTEGIYLQIGMVWLLPTQQYPFNEIRAIMFDPSGATVWDYLKTTEPLGDGNLRGPGIVPTVDTPYGRLATVICFDASFLNLSRGRRRRHADPLVPSSDGPRRPTPSTSRGRDARSRRDQPGTRGAKGSSLGVDHPGRILGRIELVPGRPGQHRAHADRGGADRGARTPYALFFGDVLDGRRSRGSSGRRRSSSSAAGRPGQLPRPGGSTMTSRKPRTPAPATKGQLTRVLHHRAHRARAGFVRVPWGRKGMVSI